MLGQKIAIVIPTLNEEKTIVRVISSLPKKYRANVYVADCQSSDHTVELAKKLGAKIVISYKRTYDHPCFLGSEQALKDGAKILLYFHAGGDDDPHDIAILVKPILLGKADLVMGSRTKSNLKTHSLLKHQKIGTDIVVRLINFLFHANFTDIGPFRAIKSDIYKSMKMHPLGFSFPSQMLIKALKKKYRVVEMPVVSHPRIGKSKISGSFTKSLQAGLHMFLSFKYILSF